ncbi:MAG: hypothetical protein K8L97_05660 [Anaerolineae bacterium]|nr:hypothetical protein [Anaerolineae bacterium]
MGLLTAFGSPPSVLQTEPTPTVTPTSQPAPPILVYPPDGAVLTQSITIQELEFITTGFITHVTVRGENFTAQWCVELHIDCMPYDFENENELLPDGTYEWQVFTAKAMGSAQSETWSFRVDTQDSNDLPLMLTATPTPTQGSFFSRMLQFFGIR